MSENTLENASEEFITWNREMVAAWNDWINSAPWEHLSPAEKAIIDKLGEAWIVARQQGLEIDILKQRISALENSDAS